MREVIGNNVEVMRRIAESAHCILWYAHIRDEEGELKWYMNMPDEEAAQRFLPVKRTPGNSYSHDWYFSRHPDDRQKVDNWGENHVRHNRSYIQEFRCITEDGEIHWLREDVRIRPLEPGQWEAVGVCYDVTAEKQAKMQANQLAEHTLAVFWTARVTAEEAGGPLNWDLRILNPEMALRIVPIQIPSGLRIDQAIYERRPRQISDRMDQFAEERIWSGASSYTQEFPVDTGSSDVWLQESVIIEPAGPLEWQASGVCVNITKRKKQEQLARQMAHYATGGRLRLVEKPEEIVADRRYFVEGGKLKDREEVQIFRHLLETMGLEAGMEVEKARDLNLAVGETATNAIVHGVEKRRHHASAGEDRDLIVAEYELFRYPDRLVARISDPGFGMDVLEDPQLLFVTGYSTRMPGEEGGMGWTFILKLVDHSIWLYSGRDGTIVQLEMTCPPKSARQEELAEEETMVAQ